ncbi:MAG: four helix bundle protein [Dehalococcoidales bacterium]|nr:four helix bundle protein [Dehalococcoidales bacterium]
MPNQIKNPNDKKKYDLVERTANFGKATLIFLRTIPENTINRPLVSQLVRSATSIGANYMEADCAESKKDFNHKIGICKKESKETTHWLHMLATANPEGKDKCRELWKEAHELTLIFSSIIKNR